MGSVSLVPYAAAAINFGLPDPKDQTYVYGYASATFFDNTDPVATQETLRQMSLVATRDSTLDSLFVTLVAPNGGCGSAADAQFTVWQQSGCGGSFVETPLSVTVPIGADATPTGYCVSDISDSVSLQTNDRYALVSTCSIACEIQLDLSMSLNLSYP
jgi:hypothetical protein